MKLRIMMLFSFSFLFNGGIFAQNQNPENAVVELFANPPSGFGFAMWSGYQAVHLILSSIVAGKSKGIFWVAVQLAIEVKAGKDADAFAESGSGRDYIGWIPCLAGALKEGEAASGDILSGFATAVKRECASAIAILSYVTALAHAGDSDAAVVVDAFAQIGVTAVADAQALDAFFKDVFSVDSDKEIVLNELDDIFAKAIIIDAAIAGDGDAFELAVGSADHIDAVAYAKSFVSNLVSSAASAYADVSSSVATILAFFDVAAEYGMKNADAVVVAFEDVYTAASVNIPIARCDVFAATRAQVRAAISHAVVAVLPAAYAKSDE